MARTRRVWSSLRDDIRRWLNDDSTPTQWSDADLLAFFNESKDHREMELYEQHEGYGVFRYNDSLVAGQQEYALPEETGRIRTLWIVDSGGSQKRAVQQDRQFTGTYLGDDNQAGTSHYSYSLKDNHVFLYPCPSQSVTNGLQFEIEVATERIVNDNDKLPDSWPPFIETLLVYDTAIAALDQQSTSEGDQGESQRLFLSRRRERYEDMWFEYTASRTTSVVMSPGWNQGA